MQKEGLYFLCRAQAHQDDVLRLVRPWMAGPEKKI